LAKYNTVSDAIKNNADNKGDQSTDDYGSPSDNNNQDANYIPITSAAEPEVSSSLDRKEVAWA
jgi:hypothetical protein